MKTFSIVAGILALGSLVQARDSRATFELLKKGSSLSSKEVERLEERVAKNPKDEESRIQLLSFYSAPPAGTDLAVVKTARAKHILWLISNDPKEGLGLFQVATRVYQLHCQGDDLADPEAFRRSSEAWIEQVRKNPAQEEIRRAAVDAIQFCAPEKAEEILLAANDRSGLGRLYAGAILGITGWSYVNNEPAGSDAGFRE